MAGTPIQGSFFEKDYLLRTLGPLASQADVALTELVANAWDAGARTVRITLPTERDEQLIVEDDGTGLTREQFMARWMTLGYNRVEHQGRWATFPGDVEEPGRRRAYGRNGVGRHGMLCFADDYEVATWRDGSGHRFSVATTSGNNPFVLIDEEPFQKDGHGTRLVTTPVRNLPPVRRIRELLSGRFLHDPQFAVYVNGDTVALGEHEGLIEQSRLEIGDGVTLNVFVVDTTKASRRLYNHGVAFWVGRRLVGQPSWIVGSESLADGRTAVAKRHTVVVSTDDLFDEVLPDWSGFKSSAVVERVFAAVGEVVEGVMARLMASRIDETKEAVLREHRSDLSKLRPLARLEVGEFMETITRRDPTIRPDLLATAVQAVINLEKSRTGAMLLQKLTQLEPEDVDGLNRLLEAWTVRDALTVLDEIDRRIAVVEALGRLSTDPHVDELKTLHPLVTQARWLFGPEFDSPLYAANNSIRRAMEKVFGKRVGTTSFVNHRKRPDLLVLPDATLSAVASEEIDEETSLSTIQRILLVELKRGDSTIGREELQQAEGYVEDLLHSGIIDGAPYIHAVVVGTNLGAKTSPTRSVGEKPVLARIHACTFDQLVRTAELRLFRLRGELESRYADVPDEDLMRRVIHEGDQLDLPAPEERELAS